MLAERLKRVAAKYERLEKIQKATDSRLNSEYEESERLNNRLMQVINEKEQLEGKIQSKDNDSYEANIRQ